MIELLAPAGNKQNLITAVNSGANAVYLGLKNFSARMNSSNFDIEELKYSIAYAHTFNVLVYITVNTLIKDNEIEDFLNDINLAYNLGADAFIVQDIFLGKLIHKYIPNAILHLSTQAGVCNEYGGIQAKKYGFSRVIVARETSLEDIKKISKIIDTEVFIQGALCSSFSGHCYFSSFIGGQSGNRGQCKQPCRKCYSYYYDNQKLTNGYSLSLSDLCNKNKIKELIDSGVKSFKIEGRMRSQEYVAISTQFYRKLIDGNYDSKLFNALQIVFNRGDYTESLAFGQKNYISNKIQSNKGLIVGKVTGINNDTLKFTGNYTEAENDCFKILRDNFEVGNAICIKLNNKLVIKYRGQVKINDYISLTKSDILKEYIIDNKYKELTINVKAKLSEKLQLSCDGVTVISNDVLSLAKTQSATNKDIIDCLNKTDVFPFKVTKVNIELDNNVFILKSIINNLRVELYSKLFYRKVDKIYDKINYYNNFSIINNNVNNKKSCLIYSYILPNFDITDFVYFPLDYNKIDFNVINYYKNLSIKVWLYIPPYLNSLDLKIIDNIYKYFDGVYAENYWVKEYAESKNIPIFYGVGFNIFNKIDFDEANKNSSNIAVSKELSLTEINNISNNVFLLNNSNIELMDFIYCPFNKKCNTCINKNYYDCIDEDKRKFTLIRYKVSECRFKLFNNADIKVNYNRNIIYDFRAINKEEITNYIESNNKKITSGNYLRGVK